MNVYVSTCTGMCMSVQVRVRQYMYRNMYMSKISAIGLETFFFLNSLQINSDEIIAPLLLKS
jgi:hypothetical protein